MTTTRTVAELKAAAGRVLNLVDLQSVSLMRAEYQSIHRDGEISLVAAFAIQTRAERSGSAVRAWVKHRAWALAIGEGVEVPDDVSEVPAEFIDEHYAWKAETEWVAEYISDSDDLGELHQEDCAAFSLVMGPPTVHPYARELIQSLSERGLYPALSLSLIHPITQLPDDDEVEID